MIYFYYYFIILFYDIFITILLSYFMIFIFHYRQSLRCGMFFAGEVYIYTLKYLDILTNAPPFPTPQKKEGKKRLKNL